MVDRIELEETKKFIDDNNNITNEVSVAIRDNKKLLAEFQGLSKEEVIKFGSDPAWVKARWILFISFWLIWIALIVGAVLVVVLTPGCPVIEKLEWYQKEIVYKVNVDKFLDTNGDGVGDLNGIKEKLTYFETIGVKSILINNVLTDGKNLDPKYGDEDNLATLKRELENKDMHIIMKMPANVIVKDDLEYLLKQLVHGILVTDLNDYKNEAKKLDEFLKELVKTANEISKKTFKKKFIGVEINDNYDSVKDAGMDLIVNHELDDIDNSLNKPVDLLNKLKKLYPEGSKSWKTLSFSPSDKCSGIDEEKAQFKKILLLFLKGTPILKQGDEINLAEECEYMKWDLTPNCGFTTSKNFTNNKNCSKTIEYVSAHGSGATFYKNLKKLANLRNANSLQFGKVQFHENETDSFTFVREAKGFEGFLIASNPSNSNLVKNYVTHFQPELELPETGTVVFFNRNNPDFSENSEIPLNKIFLNKGDILIVKFNREKKAEPEAQQSSGGH